MAEDKQRRARGASPLGVFETSKAAAFETIESEKQAERSKVRNCALFDNNAINGSRTEWKNDGLDIRRAS